MWPVLGIEDNLVIWNGELTMNELDKCRNNWCLVQFLVSLWIGQNPSNSCLFWALVATWVVSFTLFCFFFVKSVKEFFNGRKVEVA